MECLTEESDIWNQCNFPFLKEIYLIFKKIKKVLVYCS